MTPLIIGPFTFYNADNMDVIPGCAVNEFDWLIDDPSYGIKEDHWRKSKKVNGALVPRKDYPRVVWSNPIPSQEYFNEVFRISKQQIIWGINYFTGSRTGFTSPGRIVWNKLNGESNWSDCELAYCSAHHTTRYFEFMWNGMMQGVSMLKGKTMQGNKKLNQQRIHDTEKPIELYKWIILKYLEPGSTIIDCHGGSMSLLIAAHYLNTFHDYNLKITVIENDKPTFDKAVRRFGNYYNQQVVKEAV